MIAQIDGTLISSAPTCVVSVGGVGFELQIPEKDRTLLTSSGNTVSFHTHLYVRDDRLTLFGFLRREDRELFTRLIGVSGIGPRIALGILGEHSTGRIVQAITDGDHGFLCKLPGLGRKTSERLIMELKDKLSTLDVKLPSQRLTGTPALREEAVQALTTLGITRGVAEEALEKIDWKSEADSSLSDIVKQALKLASQI